MFPEGLSSASPPESATPGELVEFVLRAVQLSRANVHQALHADCDKRWLREQLEYIERIRRLISRYEEALGSTLSSEDRTRHVYLREQLDHHADVLSEALAKPEFQEQMFLAVQAELDQREIPVTATQLWDFLTRMRTTRGTITGLADEFELAYLEASAEVDEPSVPLWDVDPEADDEGDDWKQGTCDL